MRSVEGYVRRNQWSCVMYSMETKLECSTLKHLRWVLTHCHLFIFSEVRVMILNYVSPCCFETSFIRLLCVLLEDKQNGKYKEVGIPWILPVCGHCIYLV